MENLGSLLAMVISDLLIIGIIIMLKKQREKTQLRQAFLLLLVFMFIWTFGSILQILFQNYPIDPFLFEKFTQSCIDIVQNMQKYLDYFFHLW